MEEGGFEDGTRPSWQALIRATHPVFRESIHTGRVGCLRSRPWDEIPMPRVVRQYPRIHIIAVPLRSAQGT